MNVDERQKLLQRADAHLVAARDLLTKGDPATAIRHVESSKLALQKILAGQSA